MLKKFTIYITILTGLVSCQSSTSEQQAEKLDASTTDKKIFALVDSMHVRSVSYQRMANLQEVKPRLVMANEYIAEFKSIRKMVEDIKVEPMAKEYKSAALEYASAYVSLAENEFVAYARNIENHGDVYFARMDSISQVVEKKSTDARHAYEKAREKFSKDNKFKVEYY